MHFLHTISIDLMTINNPFILYIYIYIYYESVGRQ